MVFPDVSEVELCSSSSSQGIDCTDEVTPFGHGIYYDHDGVLPIGFWELHDEVDANGIPRRIQDWKWVQFSSRRLANRFCVKAHIAHRHVLAYIPRHLWPPVIP